MSLEVDAENRDHQLLPFHDRRLREFFCSDESFDTVGDSDEGADRRELGDLATHSLADHVGE